jgi:hypothetical protein
MHILRSNGKGRTQHTRFGPVFINYAPAGGTKKSESTFETLILHNTVTRKNLNTKEMVQPKVPGLRINMLQGTNWCLELELM